jgi:hypothetical protein
VLVYALLAVVFLTIPCFVFLIYNTGHQLQRKVETQNAADAAAVSGAGQVARSLNLAAMNNLETLRLLTVVQLLDSMPQATDYALTEQRFMLEAAQRHRNLPIPGNGWLREGLQEVEANLQDQLLRLEQLDELFDRYPIHQATYFSRLDNGEKGDLWKAMDSLQAMSTAAMENVGELSQFSAVRAAEEMQSAGSATGFMVPFVPTLPIDEEASFEDFRRPFVEGRLAERIETAAPLEFTRGPWDTVYGWREYAYSTTEFFTPQVPDHEGYASELFQFNAFSNPRRLRGDIISYSTQPAFERFANLLLQATVDAFGVSDGYDRDFAGNRETWLRTWFYAHAIGLARSKANELFGPDANGAEPFPSQGYVPLGNEDSLDWISQYEVAKGYIRTLEAAGGVGITGQRPRPIYLWLEFAEVPADQNWEPTESPELFAWGIYPERARQTDWYVRPRVDEDAAEADNAPFGDVGSYETLTRGESRRTAENPSTGQTQRYVRYLYFIWCGLNVGNIAEPGNPNPRPGVSLDQLPKPVLFAQADLLPNNAKHRRDLLTYLAVAHQPTTTPLAASLFDQDRPSNGPVALAQAVVFNTHSWDGFTPMWHAQLADVEDLEGWLDTMQATGSVTEDIVYLDPDRVGSIFRYLQAAEPLLTEVNKQ